MHKAGDDFTTQVGWGQRDDQRSLATTETHVVPLIPHERLAGVHTRERRR